MNAPDVHGTYGPIAITEAGSSCIFKGGLWSHKETVQAWPDMPQQGDLQVRPLCPPAASASTRPRQSTSPYYTWHTSSGGGSRGNGSAPPRAAAPALKDWGPNC